MKTIYITVACLFATLVSTAQVLPNSLKTVDSLLASVYSPSKPGISIAILQQGHPVFKKSYGVVNIATKKPITEASNFNIGSLTKQFTAMGILQLAHSGKLKLDDKLSLYFPDMIKHIANLVTIRHLLTHTSGIVDHYAYVNTNTVRHAHNADVYAAIKNVDSTYFAPGSHFRYSNTGFCLLALVIERVSGLPYPDYLQKNIFQPAGMLHTTVWSENADITNPVTGYEIDSATNSFAVSGAEGNPFFSTEGDGGIYTSINDYLKWFAALQGGKIFTPPVVNEARSLHFTIDSVGKAGYGYGWFVDTGHAPIKVYHSGSNGGYRSYSFTIPATGYLVVIFSNRGDVDLDTLVKKINQLLLPSYTYTTVEEMVQ